MPDEFEAQDPEVVQAAVKRLDQLNRRSSLETDEGREDWTFRNILIDRPVPSSFDEWYTEERKGDNQYNYNTDRETARQIATDLWAVWITALYKPWYREDITRWALERSLCPYHFIDYAICFDDDDPACAMIRLIHPSHDT